MTLTPPPSCGLPHLVSWVFDLDNTLYPASTDVFRQIDKRMKRFIARFLDVSEEEAFVVQKHYYHLYGTSMRGLMIEHGMDPHDFMDAVHDIDHSVIPSLPDLDRALAGLDGRKVVFTNGSLRHAEMVLERVGIAHHFEAIFDIEAGAFIPKPSPETYRAMLDRFGLRPQDSAMFEDSLKNLVPAAAMGMTTVLVRDRWHWAFDADADTSHCHHITEDLVQWLGDLVAARTAARPVSRSAG
ncbi:pyrimidine 5'-nucleotidase [Roseospira visakhapatnamensis]|uniref:Putative hydrolase of the HAD superfamily n=1 Tax=Roseospira visakhapatnamensis TaxID=390880 RepID=A0A7W6RGW7_9PROT|nr:pyrimidine 5'-nucleotidase [Roseospira visakhapatnamensis]MBB4267643.1 putative hydrolase of the HAD superfamily [Roseospira visakhapatnamensis]